jgi:uncharacterized protein
MNTLTESPERIELAPLPANQRIEALDAVRGFALIGICLMNIEFFNRAMAGLGQGMPVGLTGINWLASYFVAYFVAGKFWTIFSLLFGMGFAVMLTRAERAGRGLLKPYLRRIAALAVFGALHHIFLFAGDILFSYAVAALFLLVVLYANAKWLAGAIAVAIGLAFIPGFGPAAGSTAVTLAFAGVVAIYMRGESKPFGLPAITVALLAMSLIAAIAALVFWFVPNTPQDARGPVTAMCGVFLLLSFLAQKFRDPVDARPRRAGATIYVFFATMMTIGGLVDYLTPPEPVTAVVAAPAATAAKADLKKPLVKPALTEAQKKAEREAENAKNLKEKAEELALETKVMSTGSYTELITLRAKHFAKHAPMESGFATLLIGMFLLGVWFIRSGVMENSGAHLPLFRKLAFIGLPAGIALGMLGSLIAVTHIPGTEHDGFFLAHGLLTFGNLPACLGYVAMIVLMLHSRSAFGKVRVLAPFGRMALTNYLCQSLVMGWVFLGYGLGQWDMPRAGQVLFALALCGVQIAFSHWWLARFRYGPAEWLWRAITYLRIPAMRIEPAAGGLHAQPSR